MGRIEKQSRIEPASVGVGELDCIGDKKINIVITSRKCHTKQRKKMNTIVSF